MALILCPECKEKVSSSAKICPHCGYPISEITSIETDPNKESTQNNNINVADEAVDEAAEDVKEDLKSLYKSFSNTPNNNTTKSNTTKSNTTKTVNKKKIIMTIVFLGMIAVVVAIIINMFRNPLVEKGQFRHEINDYEAVYIEFDANTFTYSHNYYKYDSSSPTGKTKDSLTSYEFTVPIEYDIIHHKFTIDKEYTYHLSDDHGIKSLYVEPELLALSKRWE